MKRSESLRREYGLTLDDYDRILESQGGHCAVCDRRSNDDGTRLHVDHDHATGKVRGILCGQHNRAFGLVADDPTTLLRMLEYILNARGSGR